MAPPLIRRPALEARRRAHRLRRRAFERLGSDRHSRPANGDLERQLEPLLPPGSGFFVEAGAYDGFAGSTTYWLERFRGWRGVLVEPIPALYRRCVAQRPRAQVFNCALVAPEFGDPEVTMLYGGSMSVVKGAWDAARSPGHVESQASWSARGCAAMADRPYEVSVPARTLTSVLEDAGADAIDLLSLDVEGHELAVLAGLDLARFAPRLILIEIFEEFGPGRTEVECALGPEYVEVLRPTPHDVLFRRA